MFTGKQAKVYPSLLLTSQCGSQASGFWCRLDGVAESPRFHSHQVSCQVLPFSPAAVAQASKCKPVSHLTLGHSALKGCSRKNLKRLATLDVKGPVIPVAAKSLEGRTLLTHQLPPHTLKTQYSWLKAASLKHGNVPETNYILFGI